MPGSPSKRVDRKPGVVGDRRQLRCLRCRHRLDARILDEARPCFVGFGQAEFSRRCRLNAEGREQLAHFAQFAGIMGRDHDPPFQPAPHTVQLTVSFCNSTRRPMPFLASAIRAASWSSVNGVFSAVPWNLDDAAIARHDEIHVGIGLGVFGVIEIEHRLALKHAAGNRRDMILQWIARHHLARLHPGNAVIKCDPGPCDRGGSRAAVGLQHVAVDRDLPFAERDEIGDRAQRPADEPLDLERPAGLLAGGCLAPRPFVRRARQHAVFGRDPAAPLTLEPGRQLSPRALRPRAHGCRRTSRGRNLRHGAADRARNLRHAFRLWRGGLDA